MRAKSAIYILTLTLSHDYLRCPQACFAITLVLQPFLYAVKRRFIAVSWGLWAFTVDRFQSRGQWFFKLLGIKESFKLLKLVRFPQDFFRTQTWPPSHCFVLKYGRRDVM